MPAANPLADTGSVSASSTLGSSQYNGGSATVGGSTNITVAGLVGASLLVIIGFHLLGFRFAFDVSVGKR